MDKFKIQSIPEEMKEELYKEITEEISEVIKQMKLNKSPGPDGFMAIFYKKMQEELTPILKELFSTVVKQKRPPETWSEAFITLIYKEQQDLSLVKSYRPISLLNEDYKIYAKLWANRLKNVLNKFITDGQAGFLPGRPLRDNIRYIINKIEFYDKKPDREIAWFFYQCRKSV